MIALLWAFSTVGANAASASLGDRFQASLQAPDLSVPGNNTLSYCADPQSYLLDIHAVDLDPMIPSAGENLTIEAYGYLNEVIEADAKVLFSVKIKVGNTLIPILTEEVDLCEQLEGEDADFKCPLEKGDVSVKKALSLPEEIPKATYVATAQALMNDSRVITCMEVTMTFK